MINFFICHSKFYLKITFRYTWRNFENLVLRVPLTTVLSTINRLYCFE